MNLNSRNERVLACLAGATHWSVGRRSQRAPKRMTVGLPALVFGVLFSIGLSDQVFAQALAPAPSITQEWTSVVDPVTSDTPATQIPLEPNSSLDATTFNHQSPLANLRQSDPSELLTEAPTAEQIQANTNYSNRQNRNEQTLAVGWNQPELRHRRLYFEDQQIERGNAQRQFPNAAAGANFVKSLIAFPIRLVTGR